MSIESLRGVTEQLPILRLIDVVSALEKRGRQEDADYYGGFYPLFISLIYDIPEDEVMLMNIDEISELSMLPQKPLKYEGWNTFFFGKAAFNGNG